MSSYLPTVPEAILLDLYASAAEPTRWPRALDQICQQTGASSAVVMALSFDNGLTRMLWAAKDSRTERMQHPAHSSVPNSSNPRLDHRRALRGLNRIAGDELLFDAGDEARVRLQQELAA